MYLVCFYAVCPPKTLGQLTLVSPLPLVYPHNNLVKWVRLRKDDWPAVIQQALCEPLWGSCLGDTGMDSHSAVGTCWMVVGQPHTLSLI